MVKKIAAEEREYTLNKAGEWKYDFCWVYRWIRWLKELVNKGIRLIRDTQIIYNISDEGKYKSQYKENNNLKLFVFKI